MDTILTDFIVLVKLIRWWILRYISNKVIFSIFIITIMIIIITIIIVIIIIIIIIITIIITRCQQKHTF